MRGRSSGCWQDRKNSSVSGRDRGRTP
jgi:hypothetical protein